MERAGKKYFFIAGPAWLDVALKSHFGRLVRAVGHGLRLDGVGAP
jgi:hypothetical protein